MSVHPLPTVSVVVVNYNGLKHLEDCFNSLAVVDYPRDLLEIVCVDNGSTDGSIEFLADLPNVKVIRSPSNAGFASGCNLGARESSGRYIAFANNDMKVDPGWIAGLLDPIDETAGVVCTSGRILDWEGVSIDFLRGAVNLHGFGIQVGAGKLTDEAPQVEGQLLFACGGSMLVDREVFLHLGGFDDDFFAYFEDLDFGWRAWVCGYEVAAAPDAISFHRIHGSSASLPSYRLQRHYERNALMSVFKNASEANVGKLLATAALLAAYRAKMESSIETGPYDLMSSEVIEEEHLSPMGAAALVGMSDLIEALPRLQQKRVEIQRLRKRSDVEIFQRFERPFQPVSRVDSYLKIQASLISALGLEQMFDGDEAAFVLIIAQAASQVRAAWESRAWELASPLAGIYEATFTAKSPEKEGIRVADLDAQPGRLEGLAQLHEVIVVHSSWSQLEELPQGPLLVVDLSGCDPKASIARRAVAADLFLVTTRNEMIGWKQALAEMGVEAEVVVDTDGRTLVEVCRNPDRFRNPRSPYGTFRYDLQVLADNWERRNAELALELQRQAGRSDELQSILDVANEDLSRLRRLMFVRVYEGLRRRLGRRSQR